MAQQSRNRAIENGAVAVYVFEAFWADCGTVDGAYATATIYRKLTGASVRYQGHNHALRYTLVTSGAHYVPCIFVNR